MRGFNLQPVTLNLLIINVLVYIIALVSAQSGSNLGFYLSAHYFNVPTFEPYQIVTHMFMHDLMGIRHILFNMLILVMFGNHLERIWGAKRFFIFYFASGIGALALYNIIGMIEVHQIQEALIADGYQIDVVNEGIMGDIHLYLNSFESQALLDRYESYTFSSMAGASGALFGVMAAFAILFPNTELFLFFIPFPIKAKYLIGGYILFEIYNSIYQPNDHIAHLAHVGGAIVGTAFVLYWRRFDKQNFY